MFTGISNFLYNRVSYSQQPGEQPDSVSSAVPATFISSTMVFDWKNIRPAVTAITIARTAAISSSDISISSATPKYTSIQG